MTARATTPGRSPGATSRRPTRTRRRSSTPACSAGSTTSSRSTTTPRTRWGSSATRTAAAISPQQSSETEQGIPPHWNVYVTVDDVDETTGKVDEAGGTVLAGPFDVFNVGKMSVIADPTGAVLCLWQADDSIGAEVVNEPGALAWADTATPRRRGGRRSSTARCSGGSFDQMSEAPPYWVIRNGDRSQGGMTVPPPGRAGQLVPVLRGRGRRRVGEAGRRGRRQARSWARSTSPAAASR